MVVVIAILEGAGPPVARRAGTVVRPKLHPPEICIILKLMKKIPVMLITLLLAQAAAAQQPRFINEPDSGYRGIWYSIGPTGNEYAYKYGGGLGTYPSNHYPFSVYAPAVNKTFFCYGGTDSTGKTLLHEVGCFDHATGMVSRPTVVMDKATDDAHDNPVIQIDSKGYIWLFSTSHGVTRPSFVYRSSKPYNIGSFEKVQAYKGDEVMDNFSYLQMYYQPGDGFLGLFTHYETQQLRYGKKNCRIIAYMTSKDGIHWSPWKDLANMEEGHYQTTGQQGRRVGSAFNHHPNVQKGAGLDYRTNLYYLQTNDFGRTWTTVDGRPAALPLRTGDTSALVKDYASEGLNVYINDVNFDAAGNPVILYETSRGPAPGPVNGMRQWYTAHWKNGQWQILPFAASDNNYDMGSLMIEKSGVWRVIAPTAEGPQAYNTGGEIVMWESRNEGKRWASRQLTRNSARNHSYPRRPVNAHEGFYAFWADGHGRQQSTSRLYFSDRNGNVYMLPEKMSKEWERPQRLKP